jgi:signal peptidase I
MTIIQNLILYFSAIQIIHFLGTWKLYIKAGYKSWQALVPVYNVIILMKIIRKPKWWVFLLFIPTINIIMILVIWVETLSVFGKKNYKDIFLVIITLGFYIYYVNYVLNCEYELQESKKPKSNLRETVSSLIFAIIAATIVHNYIIQPFIIPTGSLEKSLLIGDFLFVSKFHYGARIPMTTISFPMVHDTIPFVKTRSYLNKPQLPYLRLPGLQKIKRNDIVVFSWPADTVRKFFVKEKGVKKPIDKKSNYVKRCVGIPGDTLEIIDGFVFINGSKNKLPNRARVQYTHKAYNKKGVSSRKLLEYGINDFYRKYKVENINQNTYKKILPYIVGTSGNTLDNLILITKERGLPLDLVKSLGLKITELLELEKELTLTINKAEKLKGEKWIDSVNQVITKLKTPNTAFFPNRIPFDWNEDNFGPIIIPKKNQRISINKKNLPLYKKIITDYEKNELYTDSENIYINNVKISEYKFKQDYFWMMGDNRHRSEDSRFWGFVPNDHIVGKPVFIWFSIDGINDGIKTWKIRWNRVFTTVGGSGERTSYFPHFIIFIALFQVINFLKKYKNKKV